MTHTIQIRSLTVCGFLRAYRPETLLRKKKSTEGDDKMKEEKVRIKVRLTEEEKEKLERNSALCGLTQSGYVRQLCRGVHPKPKPPDVFWQLMDELYKAHSNLKECAKYEPSALKLCVEIERLVLDLQEVI